MLPIVQSKISTEEFQITDWATQIAELQARIAASQTRINQLNEDNAVADGLLQAAQDAKGKISDQEVIADLLAHLSQLLGGGDNGNDGNGNLPLEPAPQPNDDGGAEVVVEADQASSAVRTMPVEATEALTGQSSEWASPWASPLASPLASTLCCQMEDAPTEALQGQAVDLAQIAYSRHGFKYLDDDAIAVNSEALTGQSSEWASPLATPFASPLATPLCCQLEDCPQSVLAGQSVEIACVVSDAPKKPEYIELVPVSREVHYQRRTHDGEIICAYLGGNNKQKLKLWGEWLCNQHSVGSGFQLREAERLTAFKYELKIWGMSLSQIQRLAESNTTKNPPSNFGTAPKRKIEPVAPLPKPLQIEDIEVGDMFATPQSRIGHMWC